MKFSLSVSSFVLRVARSRLFVVLARMRLRMLVRMRMRLWFLAPRLSLTRLSVTLCANLLLSLPPGCRPFFVLSAATCYSCSIYCVFLMSKLHFIMSLVRGKAYDRMGEKGETSSLATYARCWLLGCCWLAALVVGVAGSVVAVVNFIYHLTFFTLFMPLQSGG